MTTLLLLSVNVAFTSSVEPMRMLDVAGVRVIPVTAFTLTVKSAVSESAAVVAEAARVAVTVIVAVPVP